MTELKKPLPLQVQVHLLLAGAVSGFETFSTAIGNTNTTYYSIVNENGEFEVGSRNSRSWNFS